MVKISQDPFSARKSQITEDKMIFLYNGSYEEFLHQRIFWKNGIKEVWDGGIYNIGDALND